jgi:hypothetical protein
MAVVVNQVLAEHGEQVLRVVDQDAIQALPPYRAYPAFRIRVRAGRLRRREKTLDTSRAQHRVEHRRVFGVAISDDEPKLVGPLPQLDHQVAGLLRHPLPGRVRGGAQQVHPPGGDLHQEQHVDAGQADRVHV